MYSLVLTYLHTDISDSLLMAYFIQRNFKHFAGNQTISDRLYEYLQIL